MKEAMDMNVLSELEITRIVGLCIGIRIPPLSFGIRIYEHRS